MTRPATPGELLVLLSDVPSGAPITESLLGVHVDDHNHKRTWIGSLSEHHGPGYYNRKAPVKDVRSVYTKLQSVSMLLWLCEQVGATEQELTDAARAAAGLATTSAKAAAVRRLIPWERVEALLESKRPVPPRSEPKIITPSPRRPRSISDDEPASPERKARVAMPTKGDKKIETPRELRDAIHRLSPSSPLTHRFTARWRAAKGDLQKETKTARYSTQHEHWLGWLGGYGGPGGYNRKDWQRTAEFVYNHIVNPQMLIYLAEAVGLPEELVNKAADAALAKPTTMANISGAIRRVIPWAVVEEALRTKIG